MKLIPGIFSKKAVVATACILAVVAANARVFWNKVEATVTNDNTVILTWNVTEYNNKYFVVQHSMDGIKWEDIHIVLSKNSAESMTDYSYAHKNRFTGKQYYRLKDVDIDISYTSFSPIKTLMLKYEKPIVSVWPNPATDRIVIENSDNDNLKTKATIFNLAGRAMIERKLNANTNEIAINELSAGTYIIKIENSKGTSQSQKIVKQ